MRSKISCFNWTIFRKNLFRFWPIWSLYLAILLINMPLSIFMQTASAASQFQGEEFLSYQLSALSAAINTSLHVLPFCVFAIISAIAVFSYLYSSRSCDAIHAFPLTRKELFVTNYVSGLVFLIGPQILTFLVSLVVCIVRNVTQVEHLLFWLLFSMGMSFFFYSLSVFCCMISGHLCASFAYFILILAVFRLIKYLMSNILVAIGFGFSGTSISLFYSMAGIPGEILSPYTLLNDLVGVQNTIADSGYIASVSITGGLYVALYCIPAAALLVISGILYQHRQLETAGDIISVPWLKPVFRWCVAVLGGLAGGYLLAGMLTVKPGNLFVMMLFFTVLFTIVWYYLADMLLQKRFRVFAAKQIWQPLICLSLGLVFLGCLKGNVFGFETRIPSAEQVRVVEINGVKHYVSADRDRIEQVLDIHQEILNHRKEYQQLEENLRKSEYALDNGTDHTYVDLTYYLTNGSSLHRSYYLPVSKESIQDTDSASRKLYDLYRDPDFNFRNLVAENYQDASLRGGNFSTFREDLDMWEKFRDLSPEEAKVIWNAYQKDFAQGNVPIEFGNSEALYEKQYRNTLTLFFYCEEGLFHVVIPDQISYPQFAGAASPKPTLGMNEKEETTTEISLELYEECEYTIQALLDLGLIRDRSELVDMERYEEYLPD